MLSMDKAAEKHALAARSAAEETHTLVLDIRDPGEAEEVLLEIQARIRELERRRDEITKPLGEAKRKVEALFRPALKSYGDAKDALKALLAREAARRLALQHAAIERGDARAALAVEPLKVQTRTVRRWRVVDERKVPEKYWVLDERAVTAAVAAGVAVPGIEPYDEETIVARG